MALATHRAERSRILDGRDLSTLTVALRGFYVSASRSDQRGPSARHAVNAGFHVDFCYWEGELCRVTLQKFIARRTWRAFTRSEQRKLLAATAIPDSPEARTGPGKRKWHFAAITDGTTGIWLAKSRFADPHQELMPSAGSLDPAGVKG